MQSTGSKTFIPEEKIREIRESVSIIGVISDYVSLKKKGANHQGLCPFHQEKTPSFSVNENKNFFYCFGCHESGDVFSFLMKKRKHQL
jgi:DNA primase